MTNTEKIFHLLLLGIIDTKDIIPYANDVEIISKYLKKYPNRVPELIEHFNDYVKEFHYEFLISLDPKNIQYYPNHCASDEIMVSLIQRCPELVRYASDNILKNKQIIKFVLEASEKNYPFVAKYCSVERAVGINGACLLHFVDKTLDNIVELIELAYDTYPKILDIVDSTILDASKYISKNIKNTLYFLNNSEVTNDKDIMLKFVDACPEKFDQVPHNIPNYYELALNAVATDPENYSWLPKELLSDKRLALLGLNFWLAHLKIPVELQNDTDILDKLLKVYPAIIINSGWINVQNRNYLLKVFKLFPGMRYEDNYPELLVDNDFFLELITIVKDKNQILRYMSKEQKNDFEFLKKVYDIAGYPLVMHLGTDHYDMKIFSYIAKDI